MSAERQTNEVLRVTVANGKYTVIQLKDGRTEMLRHGEPWHPSVDNVHLALAYEVEELRTQLRKIESEFADYRTRLNDR